MHIVTAGVHHARHLTAVRKSRLLLYGKSVYICSESYTYVSFSFSSYKGYRSCRHERLYLIYPVFLQFLLNERCSSKLFSAYLGMSVYISSDLYYLRHHLLYCLQQFHVFHGFTSLKIFTFNNITFP